MRGTCLLLTAALCGVACAHVPPTPHMVRPAVRDNSDTVVLLTGKPSALGDSAAEAFVNAMVARVITYADVQAMDTDALVTAIRADHPQLIVTLGVPATRFAVAHLDDIPVLFAMVLNHGQYGWAKHLHVAGIAMEPEPAAEFALFHMVHPDLKIVDVPYTLALSEDYVQALKQALGTFGVTARLYAVPAGADAVAAMQPGPDAPNADALWVINDGWVTKQFEALQRKAARDGAALLTSLSARFVHEGAFLSVSVDFPSIGLQAAGMARLMLEEGRTPPELGIVRPLGLSLGANRTVAQKLGRTFAADVLPFIDELAGDLAPETP